MLLRFISKRLVFTALGAAVIGAGLLVSAGTASADGGYDDDKDNYGWHDNDNDWHDWDWYKKKNWDRHDDCDDDYNHGDWYGNYWNADWDEDWDGHGYPKWENDKGKHDWDGDYWKKDRDCDDNHHKVHIIYVYPSGGNFYYPYVAPEFGRYSDGLSGLIQDASIVMGVTEQWLYEELAKGRTLTDIGIERSLGPIALMEGIIAMNPDIQPYIGGIVGTPWLLQANLYIPL